MKLGIAGSGNIVKDLFRFIHEFDNIEVTALCSTKRSEEKARAMCEENSVKALFTDYDAFLADADIDVVYVAVPNHLHYSFAMKALQAGRHVICEKPFTSNDREAEELARYAKENDLFIWEAVTTRYQPNSLHIREELNNIGKVKIVVMNYSQYSSRYDAFKAGEVLPAFDASKSGGALMDLNIYNIHMCVFLFGKPERVDYLANVERGVDTSGILTLDYGAFKCVCVGAKDCKAPLANTIQGDEGCIYITTPLNAVGNYAILLNRNSSGKRVTAEDAEVLNFNAGKHRMYYEFAEFLRMFEEKDYENTYRHLDATLEAMRIQTEARRQAGIVFDADKAI